MIGGSSTSPGHVFRGAQIARKRGRPEQSDAIGGTFQCPNCQNLVAHDARSCKHCGAEFVKDAFECPECHETLHYDVKKCKRCGHSFVEKKEFVCPACGEPVDRDAKKCPKCQEEFWAPVRPPSTD